MDQVIHSARINVEALFSNELDPFPTDAELTAAYRDLQAYAEQHPVLGRSQCNSSVTIGDGGH
jgi:hypothetical protein